MKAVDFWLSPLGWMEVVSLDGLIVQVDFVDDFNGQCKRDSGCLLNEEAIRQLKEYFLGIRVSFALPIYLHGTTFQKEVWQALIKIPYGQTCSYQDVGHALGKQNYSRAVGQAVSRNPILLVVPCHRVIRHDGTMGGFGAGLARKEYLLQHESQCG